MRYELLGRLRISDGDGHSFISTLKSEIVLAVLLIRADWVVKPDELITEVWGERQPRSAAAGLYAHVSQLRKQLHHLGRDHDPIETMFPGYILHKGADETDVDLFIERIRRGRAQAQEGRHYEACESFEEALALWRGPVVGDLHNGPIVNGFATWMMESRLECLEALMEARLCLGQHRELVGRLYSLVEEHPLRESFYRYLMIALYRSNRQADALLVFQKAWRLLSEELGLAPCRELQTLQSAILAADDDSLLVPGC
jgi:DNA-binding SARP family transcriptional activator